MSLLLLLMGAATYAQHSKKGGVIAVQAPPKVVMHVEERASFPGGQTALDKYLDSAVNYPEEAWEANISGRVVVRFFIDENGKATDIKVIRGISAMCDEAAVKAIAAMRPWRPAKHDGKRIKSLMALPIIFRLN